MARDSIFRIASITKPITAASLMMLVEDGRVALGDPVAQWLPELARPSVVRTPASEVDDVVPAARPIIARDAAKAAGSSRQLLQEVATSELVWPTPAEYRRLYNYADVSGKLQAQYEAAFTPVIRG